MVVPFQQRVFAAMPASLPRMAQVVGYSTSAAMTPETVERLVVETESAIGEPIRHTIRKAFPQPLDRSIAAEVELAWKASKRVLLLSNKLSRPNLVHITAMRLPQCKGAAFPADLGIFSINIHSTGPRALDVLTRLQTYATISGAFMARADSPGWEESVRSVCQDQGVASEALFRGIRFTSEAGWAISERIGWGTYIGARCARAFGTLTAPEVIEQHIDGGATLWVTKDPLDLRNKDHFCRHAAILNELANHWHSGTKMSELRQ